MIILYIYFELPLFMKCAINKLACLEIWTDVLPETFIECSVLSLVFSNILKNTIHTSFMFYSNYY